MLEMAMSANHKMMRHMLREAFADPHHGEGGSAAPTDRPRQVEAEITCVHDDSATEAACGDGRQGRARAYID
jgi:hypothetical protein